jgi:hypothetical protein
VLLPPDRRRTLLDARIVAAYMFGTLSGALLTAMALWILSGFTEPLGDGARLALLLVGGLLVWLVKDGPLQGIVALPEARRQIPAEVFGGRLTRAAWRFGFELATGVRTYVPAAAPYVLVLVMILARPTLIGAVLIGIGFGVGRALPTALQLAPGPASRARALVRRADPAVSTAAAVAVLLGGVTLV